MIARVLRVELAADRVDAVLRAYREYVRPIHAEAVGLRQHYVLVDQETGRVEIIGIWESSEAIAAIGPRLEPARERLWSAFGCNPPLEVYEVGDELHSISTALKARHSSRGR
jgi:hypothetical protein